MAPVVAFGSAPDAGASHRFAEGLFEALFEAGVTHVCICPGSRSSALALAAAKQGSLRCWSQIDERSAGFFALGLAKATRSPVALVCTSGTAAANFHPAVIEAYYAGVPLVILTADRPPELREWGAGQTIDQVRLYGNHVRWFAEAAVPQSSQPALRYAGEIATRAVAEATGVPAGPVHLNLPFRDPLIEPPAATLDRVSVLAGDRLPAEQAMRRGDGAPKVVRSHSGVAAPLAEDVARLAELCLHCERGVITCGPMDADARLPGEIAKLATRLGWPILAEPTSQLRSGAHASGAPVIATSELFLRDPALSGQLVPELVLRFGASPTSKAQRLWLERHTPAHVVLIDPGSQWNDPDHLATDHFPVDALAFCQALARATPPSVERQAGWLDAFVAADLATSQVLRGLDDEAELLEPRAVREVAAALPEDALLYVSNSMSVRDLDAFLPVSHRGLRVLSNRGASGIDGMISSALGAAAGQAQPVVLLTGDLAFLHDVGGLLAGHRSGLDLTLVVFNNDGGGIFSFLPVAQSADPGDFEAHFRTPHGVELAPIARSFGADATRVTSWEHFRSSLKDAIATSGVSVLEVPIDRDRSVAHHREIDRLVGSALRVELGSQ